MSYESGLFLGIIIAIGVVFRKLKLEIEALDHKVNAQKHEMELLISQSAKRKDKTNV